MRTRARVALGVLVIAGAVLVGCDDDQAEIGSPEGGAVGTATIKGVVESFENSIASGRLAGGQAVRPALPD